MTRPMTLVIDASVAVKWFVEEDLADQAASLLRRPIPLYAPDLIVAEATSAVWKKFVRGAVTRAQAEAAAAAIPQSPLRLVPSRSLHQRALAIAIDLRRPVYDGLYLACAERVGGRVVTADRALLQRVEGGSFAGDVVFLPDWAAEESGAP
jgi:predicted nucleic acid-binding protein